MGCGRPIPAANLTGKRHSSFAQEGFVLGPDISSNSSQSPIRKLVCSRCQMLGIDRTELVRRSGYRNEAKGYRRLDALLAGDFDTSRGLIAALPVALEVSADVVSKAVEESKEQICSAEDARWRSSFRPHAIILTERRVQEPIFVAAMIGVDRLLRVDFDLNQSSITFVSQALKGVRYKLSAWNGVALPAFGRPIGIVVNYSPERAVKFDLTGKAAESFPKAYRIGQTLLSVGGRLFDGLK